jgi:hypothetical protein
MITPLAYHITILKVCLARTTEIRLKFNYGWIMDSRQGKAPLSSQGWRDATRRRNAHGRRNTRRTVGAYHRRRRQAAFHLLRSPASSGIRHAGDTRWGGSADSAAIVPASSGHSRLAFAICFQRQNPRGDSSNGKSAQTREIITTADAILAKTSRQQND